MHFILVAQWQSFFLKNYYVSMQGGMLLASITSPHLGLYLTLIRFPHMGMYLAPIRLLHYGIILHQSYHSIWMSVIVKKSSPKNLSADCRSTVGRQSADSWLSVSRLSADCRPFVGRQLADSRQVLPKIQATCRLTVDRQSADSRPTVGNVSVACQQLVRETLTQTLMFSLGFCLIQHPTCVIR